VLIWKREHQRLLTPFISKNKQVPETNEIRRSHYWEFTSLAGLSSAKSHIYCYRGIVGDGAFMDTNPGKTSKKGITTIIRINSSRILLHF
jgi:hypothetical protein